jgi:hypothetical protein
MLPGMKPTHSETDRRYAQRNRLRNLLEKREDEAKEKEKFEALCAQSLTPADPETDHSKALQAVEEFLNIYQGEQDIMKEEKRGYKVSAQCAMFENNRNQSTKANPSTYYTKEMPAHDKLAAANVHHTGSHYVMAGSKQFQRGVRVKGVVSRHSKQAAVRNGKRQQNDSQNTQGGVHNKKNSSMAILT